MSSMLSVRLATGPEPCYEAVLHFSSSKKASKHLFQLGGRLRAARKGKYELHAVRQVGRGPAAAAAAPSVLTERHQSQGEGGEQLEGRRQQQRTVVVHCVAAEVQHLQAGQEG